MDEFKQLRLGAVLWNTFLYCLIFLILYFYIYLFSIVLSEQFGYDLFHTEAGALCHIVCCTFGAGIVLCMTFKNQIYNDKVRVEVTSPQNEPPQNEK